MKRHLKQLCFGIPHSKDRLQKKMFFSQLLLLSLLLLAMGEMNFDQLFERDPWSLALTNTSKDHLFEPFPLALTNTTKEQDVDINNNINNNGETSEAMDAAAVIDVSQHAFSNATSEEEQEVESFGNMLQTGKQVLSLTHFFIPFIGRLWLN